MKTIFDWLTMPAFREHAGMFLGRRDSEALDIWIDDYQRACEDAGENERLRTPGGVPIHLLRDYIAMKENDTSSNGIPNILREAVGERGRRQAGNGSVLFPRRRINAIVNHLGSAYGYSP